MDINSNVAAIGINISGFLIVLAGIIYSTGARDKGLEKDVKVHDNRMNSLDESLQILQQIHNDDIMKITASHSNNSEKIAVLNTRFDGVENNIQEIKNSVEKIRDKIENGN
jgi:chromosome segregation ATPase